MRIRKLFEAVWVADAMLIALALFFAVVGGALMKSPVFILIALGAAILLALHELAQMRHRNEIVLAPEYRRARERRGF
jgi:predicted phage tail protein